MPVTFLLIHRKPFLLLASLLLFLLAAVPGGPQTAHAASPHIVISQVYGGGGNSGAIYTHDFIELFNRSGSAVDVTGWSVQYAPATNSTWNVTELSGIIEPGQYYLIRQATNGSTGISLPTPDASNDINLNAQRGKVALVNHNASLSGTCPTGGAVIDFVGYGAGSTGANCFEGSGPAQTISNSTAAIRNENGCTDTDDNATDFSAAAPAPRNSAAPRNYCPGTDDAPAVISVSPAGGAAGVPLDTSITVEFSEPVNVAGDWFTIACSSGPVAATVDGGPTLFTLHPDPGLPAGESCSVAIHAAGVTDQDANDPPDSMAADFSWSFSTAAPPPPVYQFIGFFDPVDNENINVIKAGRAVPLKWRLLHEDGVPVTDLDAVSVYVQHLTCAGLAGSGDEMEEYASGRSGLQNLGDGYYQFNWKTPKKYANSCKTLYLDLGDAGVYSAEFRFQR